jgi:hypothetical protein
MLSLFRRTLRRRGTPIDRAEAPSSEANTWDVARRRLYEQQRAPLREIDRNLAMDTRLWLLRLPPKLRPVTLADAYPRVANRLARDWSDNFMLEVCFEDLLIDRRGGRRGFPPAVVRELKRLHLFNMRYRPLIEQRMVQAPPMHLTEQDMPVLDETMMIEWEPTETIEVTERSMRRR